MRRVKNLYFVERSTALKIRHEEQRINQEEKKKVLENKSATLGIRSLMREKVKHDIPARSRLWVECLLECNLTAVLFISNLYAPCFKIREFLCHYFSKIDAQSVHDTLRQVWMTCSTKNFNVRHYAALFIC